LVKAIKELPMDRPRCREEFWGRKYTDNPGQAQAGVVVTREYDLSLPRICAYGSELNQVWTT